LSGKNKWLAFSVTILTHFVGVLCMNNDIMHQLTSESILDFLADGVYLTDMNRQIVYWNKAAERITGWRKEEVEGLSCMDGILCHVDKENRQLCGKNTCPLHRAIITGKSSSVPIIVFAKSHDGGRVPMQVHVAPICNAAGDIIGGVEVFRDMSDAMEDLFRGKKIQTQAFKWDIEEGAGLNASVHNVPHDIIGGDYYAVQQLSRHQYIFLLADVMGHGTSAALYTMYLRTLFDEYCGLFPDIGNFLHTLNHRLHQLVHKNFSFASALCGVIDMQQHSVTLAGGAHPSPFIFHSDQTVDRINISGFALGMVKEADYSTQSFTFGPGDVLFAYTDGAIENPDHTGKDLGEDGLVTILQRLGYPHKHLLHQKIENHIIRNSANVGLNDDLTFLEFHWPSVVSKL
jgi:PAS domain S-box-containing protein